MIGTHVIPEIVQPGRMIRGMVISRIFSDDEADRIVQVYNQTHNIHVALLCASNTREPSEITEEEVNECRMSTIWTEHGLFSLPSASHS